MPGPVSVLTMLWAEDDDDCDDDDCDEIEFCF
jgi:hypothetical protein